MIDVLCTTSRIHHRYAGDTGPPIQMFLRHPDVPDLAQLQEAQSEVVIWRRRGLTTILPGTNIVTVDPDTGEVTIDIDGWLPTVTWLGDWKIAVRGTFTGGNEWTFPWDVIRVGAAG